LPENTKYDSSNVEDGHNALNNLEPPKEKGDKTITETPLIKISLAELEVVLCLWALLKRIEKIKNEDQRDTAEANWFELCRMFL